MSLSISFVPSTVRARFVEVLGNVADGSSSGAVLFPGRCFIGIRICFTGDDSGVSCDGGGARRRGSVTSAGNAKERLLGSCAELEQEDKTPCVAVKLKLTGHLKSPLTHSPIVRPHQPVLQIFLAGS
jgi:hypothetical protein